VNQELHEIMQILFSRWAQVFQRLGGLNRDFLVLIGDGSHKSRGRHAGCICRQRQLPCRLTSRGCVCGS
jgi:hypothetical protein